MKGVLPKVNDRVLVEASYNANMPFKWNATRIQVLPNQVRDFNIICNKIYVVDQENELLK